MAVLSTEMFQASVMPHMDCASLLHPNTQSCSLRCFMLFRESVVATMKHLVPVYLIPILLKHKQWNPDFFKLQGIMFIRTSLMGSYLACSFVQVNCLLRYILGDFSYYRVALVPGLFGGFGILIEHPKRRSLLINFFTNVAMQGVLAALYSRKIIPRSVFLETVLFMTSNAYLMYQIQESFPKISWVFSPPPIDKNSKKCSHEGECAKDIIKSYVKYFGIGFVLELARVLLPNIKHFIIKPGLLGKLLVNKKLFRLGNALGLYVALYKLVCCSLRHTYGRNDPRYSIIAGFIAGISYGFMPTHSFLTPVINQAIQTWYSKSHLRSAFLQKVPMGEIFFALSNAYCFHLRVQDRDSCPKIFANMMNACSNGESDAIYNRYRVFLAKPGIR